MEEMTSAKEHPMTRSHDDELNRAVAHLNGATRMVALTGAGISTEAGIPDFRSSEGGLWNDLHLMVSLSSWGFRLAPERFYRQVLKLIPPLLKAQPTRTHYLLAEFERMGKLTTVITQNIDGLHQQAGSRNVIELHGTYRRAHCIDCHHAYTFEEIQNKIHQQELPPRCHRCQGLIKPDVVLFGDLLPPEALARATQAVRECDLLLVLGSSLVVYPAADLPQRAREAGVPLLIVNLEPTPYDRHAEIVIHTPLGEFSQFIGDRMGLKLHPPGASPQ